MFQEKGEEKLRSPWDWIKFVVGARRGKGKVGYKQEKSN